MLSKTDVPKANALYEEFQTISDALHNFEQDGKIVRMMVEAPSTMPVMVDTSAITYPPQMVAAIRAALEARQAAINQELTELGVASP